MKIQSQVCKYDLTASHAMLLTAMLILSGIAAFGAPSFRADKLYPEMGLKMRVPGNSTPVALSQPKTYTYTLTRGDETLKQERFDPYELWYASQHCGQWKDDEGNTFIVGRAQSHYPQFNEEHVQREQFDQALSDATATVNEHDDKALLRWVSSFAKVEPQELVKLRTALNFDLSDARFVAVNGEHPLIYLFRVTIRTPAGRKVPSEWFCAVIHLQDKSEAEKGRKAFESQFLTKVASVPRRYTTTKPDISSKELVTSRGGGSTKIADTPSRASARKSIANMHDWWYAETEEYIFLSDIRSSDGKTLVRRLQHDMPHLRSAFAALVPPFETITDTSVVRIFENAESYKQYVGQSMEWSIGAWSPMQRELIILAQGKDHDKTLEIIRHEGFHQYLFHSCNMIKTSPWLNEGHACFFERSEVDRQGRVEFHENSRVNHLMTNLDAAAALLPNILKMDYAEFYDQNAEQRALNYTTAWALIYFLHKGAPLETSNPYKYIITTYLRELKNMQDPDAATLKAFSTVKIDNLQRDFQEFYKSKRTRARRYNPLAR